MNVQVAKLSLLNGTRRTTYPEMGEVAAKRGTLYVLMEVSAPDEEWDSISRKLVDGAIEAFVVHKGPDTAALKDIATTVNGMLLEANGTRTKADAIWAGVNVVFMREGEMYLLQAGPALTYIARGSSVTRFPKSIDSTVFAPLGEADEVDSRLAKFALQIDDIVAMTGSFLPSHVAEEKLNEVMRRGTVEKVTDGLVTLAQTELSSLVIQYEPTTVMVDPKAFVTPTTTKQPIISPKPSPTVTKTPFIAPKPAPSTDTPSTPTMPMGGQRKDYSTNPPTSRMRDNEDVMSSNRGGHDEDAMSSNRGGQNEDVAPSNPPNKSVAVPQVPEAKRTEPFAPPFGNKTNGGGPPTGLPLSERFGQGAFTPSPPQDEPADTFVALPPQEEASRKKAGRTKSTTPPLKADTASGDVISGVARRVEPDESPPARSSRKKADTPRPMSPPMPMPPYATTQVATGSFSTAAAPDAPPLLRQMGALLLALFAGLLGGIAQGVGWIGRSVAPRVASSGGVLDRLSDGFWWLVDEATMAGRRIMNQMLPGDRPDPARNPRQPAPTRGDGSAFLRTLVILIPLTLAIIAAGVWFFGDEENVPAFSANLNGEGTYDSLVAEAQELINQAGNVDPQTAQGLIERALPLLDQATPLAENEGETATIAALRTQAASLLSLASTEGTGTAIIPNTIVTFATPMTSTELVYGANTVYVIDSARGALYRLLPEQPTANDLATIRPLLTAQERLAAGVTVGTPYQMTWIPAGGGRTGDGLLILTQEGQMFDFDVASSMLRQVAFAPVTGQIIASEGYGGNLYHLDVNNKQIWKYIPDGGGEYPTAPTAWLTAMGQTQLGTPIDMAIDGYIFLLDQNGEVRRFQVGEAKAGFALDAVNPPLTQPVAMAKVPPEATDLFVADAQRVVRFDQNGRFVAEYRPALGQSWGAIRDIAVNETSDLLYVLSDTGVYWVDVRK